MTSLVSRSLAHLRKLAPHCPVDKAERWVPFGEKSAKTGRGPGIRRDLFLLFDLVWLSMSTDLQEGQIVGIQVTDNAHLAEHIAKIKANPITKLWLACDAGIVVHAWAKKGERGKAKRWVLTEHEVNGRD